MQAISMLIVRLEFPNGVKYVRQTIPLALQKAKSNKF